MKAATGVAVSMFLSKPRQYDPLYRCNTFCYTPRVAKKPKLMRAYRLKPETVSEIERLAEEWECTQAAVIERVFAGIASGPVEYPGLRGDGAINEALRMGLIEHGSQVPVVSRPRGEHVANARPTFKGPIPRPKDRK